MVLSLKQMKAKSLFISVLVFIAFLPLYAQQNKPGISFSEREFDFGTFRESAGLTTHDFGFVNTGKIPLIINEVKASCGCTVPDWPRQPILPGKSGFIRVAFNPAKQNGAFNKTIQVSSNADVPLVNLVIRGVVIPSDKVEDVYKFTVGDIRLETIYAAFGEIYKGQTPGFTIKVFNTSQNEPATLSFRQVPAHLNIRMIPAILEPQQEGSIKLEYQTSNMKDWDFVVDRLELLINGKAYPNNRINITANIKEDFSTLTAVDLEKAAQAAIDNPVFDFGTVKANSMVEHNFTLTNTGKSDLIIRKVSATCGCTAVQPAKTQIRPGESTVIQATFNTTGREGNQKKAITVITNDPKRSRILLWINGIIEQ